MQRPSSARRQPRPTVIQQGIMRGQPFSMTQPGQRDKLTAMTLTCFRFLFVPILFASACALPSRAAENLLTGVIDFHCHSGPDALERSVSDLEIARIARRAGMRGLVLKNHFTSTAGRAELVRQEVPGLEVFGGIVLNRAVGGLNPEAVRRMVEFEGQRGKVVWLPTFDAENNVKYFKEDRPFVSVMKDGKAAPELAEIFRLIADHDLVLATGHSSVAEILFLIPEAKKAGVRKILVTHAMAAPILAGENDLKRMAELGAIIEHAWSTQLSGPGALSPIQRTYKQVTGAEYAKAAKAIGAEHFLISSDLGQYLNPLHTDGMKAFIRTLRQEGLRESDIDWMARKNPARLLGLAD